VFWIALLGLIVTVCEKVITKQPIIAVFVLVIIGLPLTVLTLQDIKHARYLFVFVFPLFSIGAARFLTFVAETIPSKYFLVLMSPLVLYPVLSQNLEWATIQLPLQQLERVRRGDNITAMQVEFLRRRMAPNDLVVTTFDDASLIYYLKKPVRSMVGNALHREIIDKITHKAATDGSTIWFVDTTGFLDLCLTSTSVPLHIRCQDKYPAFFRLCQQPWPDSYPCRRITIAEMSSSVARPIPR